MSERDERLDRELHSAVMRSLLSPPKGWYTFGHHASPEWDGRRPELEFWGTDDGGMPLWERPLPPVLWNGTGSLDELAEIGHAHDIFGTCLKNRYGPRCESPDAAVIAALEEARAVSMLDDALVAKVFLQSLHAQGWRIERTEERS